MIAQKIEQMFEKMPEICILKAKEKVEVVLGELETALKDEGIKFYMPPVAQESEEDLLALFSSKYAAVNAGLGWIGKNDVMITEEYGPRVRLSAVLIDYSVEVGERVTESVPLRNVEKQLEFLKITNLSVKFVFREGSLKCHKQIEKVKL